MTKTQMSPAFAKMAAGTTKGKYDEQRKAERLGGGIPFPPGTSGTGVIAGVDCKETKADAAGIKSPIVMVRVEVETPEAGRGKTLSGPGLMQVIKDGRDPTRWTKEQAWGAMLGMLENLGCPKELTQGYSDFQEVLDWFTEEPRKVSWSIVESDYGRDKKEIKAYAVIPGESSGPSADDGGKPDEDPNADYCIYLGTKYMITGSSEDGTLSLKNMNNGRERDVHKDKVEMV